MEVVEGGDLIKLASQKITSRYKKLVTNLENYDFYTSDICGEDDDWMVETSFRYIRSNQEIFSEFGSRRKPLY